MEDAKEEGVRPEKRFDKATRVKLEKRFADEYKKSNSADTEASLHEAGVFVECLEGFAEPFPEMQQQDRRREQLEAFANALDRLVDAALALDDPALGYAVHSGMEELVSCGEYSDDDRAAVKGAAGFPAICMAYDVQHFYKNDISRFCLGVRRAVKTLPSLDKNYSDEFQTAKFIEDYLGRRGIQFTTSDTGLAGESFLATMALCGKEKTRAGYWLKKAVDHEDSWKNFTDRLTQRKKNSPAE